jgi:hypothetical protein
MNKFIQTIQSFLAVSAFVLWNLSANAQTPVITKVTSSPVQGTVCPISEFVYEVSVPSEFATCQISWTASGASEVVKDRNNQARATVKWSDIPGTLGTVNATFNTCTGNEASNNTQVSLTETILSVKNLPWASFTNSYERDFCSTNATTISMPSMIVPGTGGFLEPPFQTVKYKWTLPPGYKTVDGLTGTFTVNAQIINIIPDNKDYPR